jgi:hypothetical protein
MLSVSEDVGDGGLSESIDASEEMLISGVSMEIGEPKSERKEIESELSDSEMSERAEVICSCNRRLCVA